MYAGSDMEAKDHQNQKIERTNMDRKHGDDWTMDTDMVMDIRIETHRWTEEKKHYNDAEPGELTTLNSDNSSSSRSTSCRRSTKETRINIVNGQDGISIVTEDTRRTEQTIAPKQKLTVLYTNIDSLPNKAK